MVSRVDNILTANMNDEEEEVTFSIVETGPQNPYLHYTSETGEAIVKADDDAMTTKSRSTSRPKSGKKSSTSSAGNGSTKESRPKSASRKRTN
jgi:hypothetical protein